MTHQTETHTFCKTLAGDFWVIGETSPNQMDLVVNHDTGSTFSAYIIQTLHKGEFIRIHQVREFIDGQMKTVYETTSRDDAKNVSTACKRFCEVVTIFKQVNKPNNNHNFVVYKKSKDGDLNKWLSSHNLKLIEIISAGYYSGCYVKVKNNSNTYLFSGYYNNGNDLTFSFYKNEISEV